MRGFGRVGFSSQRRCCINQTGAEAFGAFSRGSKFSRARGRYERQGLLVEENALNQAEAECLADAEARERRAERQRERQAELDQKYVEQFAKRIRELSPPVRLNENFRSPNTPVANTAAALAGQRQPGVSTKPPCCLRWRRIFDTAKQITMNCSQRNGTAPTREHRSNTGLMN